MRGSFRLVFWVLFFHFLTTSGHQATAGSRALAAAAQASDCAALTIGLLEDHGDRTEHTPIPSIEFVKERVGARGGKQILLHKKAHLPWQSMFIDLYANPQGDPRWFIQFFGIQAARFFGFEMEDASSIWLPDDTELNLAIEAINPHLIQAGHAPILLRFYEQQEVGIATYLEEFSRFRMPIASLKTGTLNHFVHDLSFHIFTMGYPPLLLDHSAMIAGEVAAFGNQLAEKLCAVGVQNGRLSDPMGWKRRFQSNYCFGTASHIDTGSAALIVAPIAKLDPGFTIATHHFYCEGDAPAMSWIDGKPIVRGSVESAVHQAYFSPLPQQAPKVFQRVATISQLITSFNRDSTREVTDLFKQFQLSRASTPGFRSAPPVSAGESCHLIHSRMEAIRTIAARLAS